MRKLITMITIVAGLSASAQYTEPEKPSASAESLSFSLKEAQDYAAKNNYQIRQAQIEIEKSASKVKETTAIGLPQISGSAGYNYFIDIPIQVVPNDAFTPGAEGVQRLQFGTPHNATAGVSINQLLFSGSYIVGLQASKAFKEKTQLDFQKTEIDIRNGVANAYFGILSAEENLDALERNKSAMDKMLSDSKAMADVGLIAAEDADQIEILNLQIENGIATAKNIKDLAYSGLAFQLGLPLDANITATDELETLIADPEEGASLATAEFDLNKHIDYQTVLKGEELQQLALKNKKMDYAPTLAGFLNYELQGYRQEFNFFSSRPFFPSTIVGAKLNVPIFTSFGTKNKVNQERLELEKVQSQKQMLEQSLKLQVSQARANYVTASNNYKTNKKNLELTERVKNNMASKYKEGVGSSMDLAQAENQYLTQLGNYVNSIYELLNARTELKKALNQY